MMISQFKGLYTALITPFTDDDELDEDGLNILLQNQLNSQVDGIVILGTTGEAPTLAENEKKQIIDITKKKCLGKASLIIGTGCYSTRRTIENMLKAENAGADAALVVTPYYNCPTQEGLYLHFKAIAEASNLPIILYNIPGRTGQNIHLDTLKKLLDIPSIKGIKEASGNILQINDVIRLVKSIRPDFSVLSGDDALTLPLMALGGDGVISVVSNIFPSEVKDLIHAMNIENLTMAREIHSDLMPYIKMAFLETNPIPIKAMHKLLKMPSGKCRLPLSELCEEHRKKIEADLMQLKDRSNNRILA
jgi:4-hydroxy-tetrahydrodipicolinate synthase